MKKTLSYRPQGTCSSQINISVDNDVISDVHFVNGCTGNGLGVGALVKGMKIADVVARLEGIDCDGRGTSCPDQLAQALKRLL
ncbi:TSCPD domain-containing protein [Bacteroidia bacterium]|nr:TSCPD domain-containing protein [Bacteroidia bacterium]